MSDQIPNDYRRACADAALKCHGTAYIFEKRAFAIRWKISLLTFLRIACPVSVGVIIGTYNLDSANIRLVLVIAGTIALFQVLLSIWALVSKWDQKLSYYLESKSANYKLSGKYDKLSKSTVLSKHDFEIEFKVLEREAEMRADLDNQHDVTDEEKRMGMRYGLRQYQRPCAGCQIIPTAMKASECGVCGNF